MKKFAKVLIITSLILFILSTILVFSNLLPIYSCFSNGEPIPTTGTCSSEGLKNTQTIIKIESTVNIASIVGGIVGAVLFAVSPRQNNPKLNKENSKK